MDATLVKLFGASWRSALGGYIEAALWIAMSIIMDAGIPNSREGWIVFGVGVLRGIMGANTKDKQVSNAPNPMAVGQEIVVRPSTGKAEKPDPGAPDAATKS